MLPARHVPCIALLLWGTALAAPDEDLLGKGDGYPVCKMPWVTALDQRCYVGNFRHYDTIVPARTVAKSPSPRPFKRPAEAPALRYVHQGRPGDIDSFLAGNRNTGLLVLKDDTILVERYQYGRGPEHRFQSFSMAKTVVAVLIG